ncbi:chromosome partitioning protein ParB [Sphingomonas koreensis]|uniref:Chromosome partitioning protein ParB n=1 Tax=Sphingomonas koreensis TaxID=93064 RepID=A0A1L6J607_9SPHN|nr:MULTISPECIES: ParB/RepB/Spo0J family partition protein [Alphaproteobacteria]APR51383.1 chromosome partitioning protein ParB [Sphingomonas koreensis]RSU21604.1 chromosome partitioning protein ParB [Sphingomonas koreensis]RSU27757.1 chromosome partitioning protein ParB [Sphingomonas koreensis]RSU29029.1 chromosome partitioning protein ParB [Sphingomonas koreensis]RSU29329.1 chromosome partitioning protein ParB [Sphingomonas koreensis]
MNAVTETVAAEPVSGVEIFVPLAKLKKSPRNARKVSHGEAAIEALAASIQHKGLIQNLVVEPEIKEDGTPTGYYLVTAGEGRRLAMLLRAKRKQIKKSEPVRCWLDTANDPSEISLDENVTRTPMHPADQFERFRELADGKGWGAEEIGARFGVSAGVVKQRLRLGAVSPKLLQVYREDGITLDQLMAFAITEDHARQEQVFEGLHHNREPWIIRRDMTASNVPATDRRAVFVGADAYVEAGGNIIRDLFSEDRGGFFEDAGLLDTLAAEKLQGVAEEIQAEGWKWAEAHIDYPHAHGMRRFYPQSVPLSDEDEARLEALSTEHGELAEGYSSYDEMPEDVAARLEAVSDEIDAISEKRSAYDAHVIAHGGAFVVLHHDGSVRVERGFVRLEDEALADPQPEPEAEGDALPPQTVEDEQPEDGDEDVQDVEGDEEPDKPISDSLTRDLSAYRTLALRVALADQIDMALVALTHTLTAQLFYSYAEAGCLEVRPTVTPLGSHADSIEDTPLAARAGEQREAWAERMPRDVANLWGFIVALDDEKRLALLAHCASRTVNALRLPWDRKPRTLQTADRLASALALDVAKDWTPTVDSYFGRVTKAHIVEAVAEGVSEDAARRIADMKKPDMARAAEQLLAGTGWLPAVLRTPQPEGEQPTEGEAIKPQDADEDAYAVAAE